MKIKLIIPVLMCLVTLGIYATGQSEGKVEVENGGVGEVVVTLKEPGSNELSIGETLIKERQFEEALSIYQSFLNRDVLDENERAEARYYTGFCKLSLGEYDEAISIFEDILAQYPNNGDAIAHAQYCLAWIEVQRGKYHGAIERLHKSLSDKNCSDRELCAQTHFMIGRIYYSYLLEEDKGLEVFRIIRDKYHDTNVINHSFFKKI